MRLVIYKIHQRRNKKSIRHAQKWIIYSVKTLVEILFYFLMVPFYIIPDELLLFPIKQISFYLYLSSVIEFLVCKLNNVPTLNLLGLASLNFVSVYKCSICREIIFQYNLTIFNLYTCMPSTDSAVV